MELGDRAGGLCLLEGVWGFRAGGRTSGHIHALGEPLARPRSSSAAAAGALKAAAERPASESQRPLEGLARPERKPQHTFSTKHHQVYRQRVQHKQNPTNNNIQTVFTGRRHFLTMVPVPLIQSPDCLEILVTRINRACRR